MKVDFYIYENLSRTQALHELCLLLETPYTERTPVHIHVAASSEADLLDKLLWTYREDSFLAHQQITTATDVTAPIQIGTLTPSPQAQGVLVNLTPVIPMFYQQFSRVIEIVFADADVQQSARERFRQYREQGCDLHTHKMKVNPA